MSDIRNRRAKRKHDRTKFYGAVSKEATERQWALYNRMRADPAIPDSHFRVLSTLLLGHYNKHLGPDFERCNPGVHTIARESGVAESTVRVAAAWLEKAGVLFIDHNEFGGGSPDNTNGYRFNWGCMASLPVPDAAAPRDTVSSSRAHLVDAYDAKTHPELHSIRRVAKALSLSHTTVRRTRERRGEDWNMQMHVPPPVPGAQNISHVSDFATNSSGKHPWNTPPGFGPVYQQDVPPDVPPASFEINDLAGGTRLRDSEGYEKSGTPLRDSDTNHVNTVRVGAALRSPLAPPSAEAARAHSASPEEEEAAARLKELLELWPIGEDEDLAGELFGQALASGGKADTILAYARTYLEITEPRYIMPLERWLRNNHWKKAPIDRRPKVKGEKKEKKATEQAEKSGPDAKKSSKPFRLTPEQREEAIARRDSEDGEDYMDIATSFGVPEDQIIARQFAFEEMEKKYGGIGGPADNFCVLADGLRVTSAAAEIEKARADIVAFEENVIDKVVEFYLSTPNYPEELDPVFGYIKTLRSITHEFRTRVDQAAERLARDPGGVDARGIVAGDWVNHKAFGYGKVTGVDGNKIDVIFDRGGRQARVVADFLEKVVQREPSRPAAPCNKVDEVQEDEEDTG